MTTTEIRDRVEAIRLMDTPGVVVARRMLDDDFIRSLAAMDGTNAIDWRVVRNQARLITGERDG